MCNCCGCFGTCCCPQGREKCCDMCNHCFCFGPMCCEMCPCGSDGCIGIPNPLCGCCGNCNLMWYASCCPVCFVADMLIATKTDEDKAQEWSNVVCNCILLMVISAILKTLSGIVAVSVIGNIGEIFEMVMYIYFMVVFGYAAKKIAAEKGYAYEPAECCEGCYMDGCSGCCGNCMKCCSSLSCCCAYFCCYDCHFIQVARVIESDAGMQQSITEGRPDNCKCCNCWQTAKPLELTTTTGRQAV